MNTRRTQPYRRGAGRPLGSALGAMLKGAPDSLPNPADAKRALQRRRRNRVQPVESQVLAELLGR